MKFRKKPIVVEAFRFGVDEMPQWATIPKEIDATGYWVVQTGEYDDSYQYFAPEAFERLFEAVEE